MQRSGLWLAGAVVYAAFFWWYTNTGGALSPAEIDRFTETMRQNGSAPEQIANLRRFMAEDEGDQFLMVNVIDLADTPAALPDVPADATSADLLGRYMAHMYPELFKRACHPAFAGRAVFQAMDLAGIDAAEHWTDAALVRYRSRRDLLEIGLNPIFAQKHDFKLAALEKTIAYPVEASLYLSDARLLLALVLLVVVSFLDMALWRRRAAN